MGWRLGLAPGVFLGEAESNTEFEQMFGWGGVRGLAGRPGLSRWPCSTHPRKQLIRNHLVRESLMELGAPASIRHLLDD